MIYQLQDIRLSCTNIVAYFIPGLLVRARLCNIRLCLFMLLKCLLSNIYAIFGISEVFRKNKMAFSTDSWVFMAYSGLAIDEKITAASMSVS